MARFARIGVGAGKTFDAGKLSPEMTTAIEHGMADAWADFAACVKQMDEGKVTSGDMFGTREYLKNNYLYRMGAAVLASTATQKRKRCIRFYAVDDTRQKLGGANRYTVALRAGPIAAGQRVLVADDV